MSPTRMNLQDCWGTGRDARGSSVGIGDRNVCNQVTEDGYYFAAYSSVTSDTLEEEVSDGRTKSFTKASHGYILDLGYAKAGEVIRIKNSNNERVDITAYKLNMSALIPHMRTLNSQTMELISFSDRKIIGTIDVEKRGNLYFRLQGKMAGRCMWMEKR